MSKNLPNQSENLKIEDLSIAPATDRSRLSGILLGASVMMTANSIARLAKKRDQDSFLQAAASFSFFIFMFKAVLENNKKLALKNATNQNTQKDQVPVAEVETSKDKNSQTQKQKGPGNRKLRRRLGRLNKKSQSDREEIVNQGSVTEVLGELTSGAVKYTQDTVYGGVKKAGNIAKNTTNFGIDIAANIINDAEFGARYSYNRVSGAVNRAVTGIKESWRSKGRGETKPTPIKAEDSSHDVVKDNSYDPSSGPFRDLNDTFTKIINGKESEIEKLQGEIKELKGELQKLKNSENPRQNLSEENKKEKELQGLKKNQEDLAGKLAQTKSLNADLAEKLQVEKAQKDEAKSKVAELQGRVEGLNGGLIIRDATIKSLKEHNEDLSKKLKDSLDELGQLRRLTDSASVTFSPDRSPARPDRELAQIDPQILSSEPSTEQQGQLSLMQNAYPYSVPVILGYVPLIQVQQLSPDQYGGTPDSRGTYHYPVNRSDEGGISNDGANQDSTRGSQGHQKGGGRS